MRYWNATTPCFPRDEKTGVGQISIFCWGVAEQPSHAEEENVFTIPTAEMTCQNTASDYIEWGNIQALVSTHENKDESDMKDEELDNGR